MESETNYDLLKFKKSPKITKILMNGETILLTCLICKFNHKSKRQNRHLMITNYAIYNLSTGNAWTSTIAKMFYSKYIIKRRIMIENITSISRSKQSQEFVVHVPKEYDYRYSHTSMTDQIIQTIVQAHLKRVSALNSEPKFKFTFFFHDVLNLDRVQTNESDMKKSISKIPKKGGQELSLDEFDQYQNNKQQEIEERAAETITILKDQKEHVTIDDFNLLKVIGRGGFGKVMLVEKKDTGKLYALKSIRKQRIIDKNQVVHTKTERFILENVKHYLSDLQYQRLKILSFLEKLYFVMKFYRGGELFQHLKERGKFSEKVTKFYGAQILCGLGHLHEMNIIYRDMKPENILLDEHGNVCLIDFGMAKILAEDTHTKSIVGTPEYIAPEILFMKAYGKPADWWSFGTLLFEMVVGLPPFYHKNQNKMFTMIKKAKLKFPQKGKISPEMKDIITQLLNRDPSKRLGTKGGYKEIMTHPWFKNYNWQLLKAKKMKAPYIPNLKTQDCTDYFDSEFTQEQPCDSFANLDEKAMQQLENQFIDFTYDDREKNTQALTQPQQNQDFNEDEFYNMNTNKFDDDDFYKMQSKDYQ